MIWSSDDEPEDIVILPRTEQIQPPSDGSKLPAAVKKPPATIGPNPSTPVLPRAVGLPPMVANPIPQQNPLRIPRPAAKAVDLLPDILPPEPDAKIPKFAPQPNSPSVFLSPTALPSDGMPLSGSLLGSSMPDRLTSAGMFSTVGSLRSDLDAPISAALPEPTIPIDDISSESECGRRSLRPSNPDMVKSDLRLGDQSDMSEDQRSRPVGTRRRMQSLQRGIGKSTPEFFPSDLKTLPIRPESSMDQLSKPKVSIGLAPQQVNPLRESYGEGSPMGLSLAESKHLTGSTWSFSESEGQLGFYPDFGDSKVNSSERRMMSKSHSTLPVIPEASLSSSSGPDLGRMTQPSEIRASASIVEQTKPLSPGQVPPPLPTAGAIMTPGLQPPLAPMPRAMTLRSQVPPIVPTVAPQPPLPDMTRAMTPTSQLPTFGSTAAPQPPLSSAGVRATAPVPPPPPAVTQEEVRAEPGESKPTPHRKVSNAECLTKPAAEAKKLRTEKEKDAMVRMLLIEKKSLDSFPWAVPIIKGIQKQQNPYMDPIAVSYSMQTEYARDMVVKLFSEDCCYLEMQQPLERTINYQAMDRILLFKSEATDEFPEVSKQVALRLLASFFYQQPKATEPLALNVGPIAPLVENSYLTCQLEDFSLAPGRERVEPVLCTAFLMKNQEMISEPWHFTSLENLVFTANYVQLEAFSKASFELPPSVEDVYFILILHRPLMAKAGETVNKYYMKGSAKKSAALATVRGWQNMRHVWMAFAWTHATLQELINANGIFSFRRPSVAPHVLTMRSIMKALTEQDLGQQLPFNISINAKTSKATHSADFIDCDVVLSSTVPWPSVPRLTFENRMLVSLNSVVLQKIPSSLKATNIFVEFSVLKGGKPVPVFSGRFSKQKRDSVTSRCCFHEKKPLFLDVFVISLPYPLSSDLVLDMKVSHATPAKAKKGKKPIPSAPFSEISRAQFPLVRDGALVPDGPYQIPLDIKDVGKDPANFVGITIQSRSSWYCTDYNLEAFKTTFDLSRLENASEYTVTVNLLTLLELVMNRMLDRTLDAIKALCIISLKVEKNVKFTEFSVGYVKHFLFRDPKSITSEFHRKLLVTWGQFIGTMDPQVDRQDRLLLECFFAAIIKSVFLTKDHDFADEFCTFVYYWSAHVGLSPLGKALNDVVLYAQFLNTMFDIGLYTFVVHGIVTQVAAMDDTANGHTVIISFLEQVLRPKLFYASAVTLDSFNKLLLGLIARTRVMRESPTLENIFYVLMHLLERFTPAMCGLVTARQIGVLDILSPLGDVHYATRMELHPVLVYFSFVLSTINEDSFSQWWRRTNKENFFGSLHFLLDKVRNNGVDRLREIVYATHFGVWKVLQLIVQQKDEAGIIGVTNIIYHFFWCDIPVDFYLYLARLLIQIIQHHFTLFLEKSQPCITKHLIKVFQQSRLSRSMTEILQVLFDVDRRCYGNTRRSMAVCCLALSFLSTAEIKRIRLTEKLPISPIIDVLVEVENVMIDPQLSQELRTEKIWLKAMTLLHSPDATIKVLSKLRDIHASNEYYAEEIQTMLLQAAIIVEFMVKQKRLDVKVFDVEVPSAIFWDLCPISKKIRCADDMGFQVQSYCDSEMFSYRSLVSHLGRIIERAVETKQFEMAYLLVDVLWPLFEDKRMFTGNLAQLFQKETQITKEIGSIPSDTDRLFGKYYRICLYGTLFEQEDGSQFIYREKKLTHLFTLSDRLVEEFSHKHPGKQIELIKVSGEVDRSTLDPDVGYIQITSVVPYFEKGELHSRMTQYEQNHLLRTFYYDTPFTKEGNQQQGPIDKQWIRRTLLTVEEAMPSILKRMKIASKTEKEYEPIRVAYRQLRMRNDGMQSAVEQSDYRQIQQLLHGSLLTQVNEGPSKMAEVFLGPNKQKTKAHEKLTRAFEDFLRINGEALALHAQWVSQNPAFMALHHELESGFAALTDRLAEYI